MTREQSNMVEYIVVIVGAFAHLHLLTNGKAYQYLRKYKGLDFLLKHYGAEHSLSIEDALEDVAAICKRHGGTLAS